MVVVDRRAIVVVLATAALGTGCASSPYEPCPVECVLPLPADAFVRCRRALARDFGPLAEADEAAFRLQTAWSPVADPPGERRATVFRESSARGDLAVVVELRWLRESLFGLPGWTTARGDAAAERDLAARIRSALAAAAPGPESRRED